MKTWQTKNASSTRESCEKLLRGLKVTHLDPILKRVRNSRYGDGVSYGDIMNGWSTITKEFKKKAIGAKDVRADVFFKFNEVNKWCPESVHLSLLLGHKRGIYFCGKCDLKVSRLDYR